MIFSCLKTGPTAHDIMADTQAAATLQTDRPPTAREALSSLLVHQVRRRVLLHLLAFQRVQDG